MIELTAELMEAISDGLMDGKSMRQIAAEPGMPSRSTMLRWLSTNPEFEAKCARSWEIQAHTMAEKVLETADACGEDNAHAAKVKISAYQWRAAKLLPKKYGDRITQEHTGEVSMTLASSIAKARKRAEAAE